MEGAEEWKSMRYGRTVFLSFSFPLFSLWCKQHVNPNNGSGFTFKKKELSAIMRD